MFAKEIEKIKELTEKLRQKGDVTEDEADWLYVVSFIPWKFWTDTSRKYKKINFSAPYDSIEELNNALEKWYSVVLQKAENQKTGNFLSTVFYIECRNDFRTQPKSLLKICQKFESCFKDGYIASDAFYSRIGHLLTGDMLEDPERGYLRFSRLRTIERIMDKEIVLARLCSFLETVRSVILSELNVPFLEKLRTGDNSVLLFPKEYDNIVRKVADIVKELPLFDSEGDCQKTALSVIKRENLKPFKTACAQTKDSIFIERVISKLESEGDISEEDADNVFLLFKYAQALAYDSYIIHLPYWEARKKQKEIFKYLNKWYGAVYKALEKGKYGNFVTTVPYYPGCSVHEAKNIKRCLDILPERKRLFHIPNKKDLKRYNSAGLHFETKEDYAFVQVLRYGMDKDLGEDYEPVMTVSGEDPKNDPYYTYMNCRQDAYYNFDLFLHGKLEAMKMVGLLPAMIGFPDRLCLAVPKKDVERARYIAEIKKEDLPEFDRFDNYVEAIIEAAVKKGMKAEIEDDSWIDIVR